MAVCVTVVVVTLRNLLELFRILWGNHIPKLRLSEMEIVDGVEVIVFSVPSEDCLPGSEISE